MNVSQAQCLIESQTYPYKKTSHTGLVLELTINPLRNCPDIADFFNTFYTGSRFFYVRLHVNNKKIKQ